MPILWVIKTVSSSLLVLPTTFTDVSGLLPRPCEAMTLAEYLNRSSFIVNRLAGSSLLSPFDLKPSRPIVSTLNTPILQRYFIYTGNR